MRCVGETDGTERCSTLEEGEFADGGFIEHFVNKLGTVRLRLPNLKSISRTIMGSSCLRKAGAPHLEQLIDALRENLCKCPKSSDDPVVYFTSFAYSYLNSSLIGFLSE